MNKRRLLIIILIITLIALVIFFILNIDTRYNKLVLKNSKWNSIIEKRSESKELFLKDIKFNDYGLLIDEKNSQIYYSTIPSNKKYNPLIDYKANEKNIKLGIKEKISEENITNNKSIEIIIYDDNNYRIYSLIISDLPILNLNYNSFNKQKTLAHIDLFDNYPDAFQRVIKSDAKLTIVKKDKEYNLELTTESLGHNTRKNNISILGMEKNNEYVLKQVEEIKDHCVKLFINNEYIGIFLIEPN